jgi:hypothetical protein
MCAGRSVLRPYEEKDVADVLARAIVEFES